MQSSSVGTYVSEHCVVERPHTSVEAGMIDKFPKQIRAPKWGERNFPKVLLATFPTPVQSLQIVPDDDTSITCLEDTFEKGNFYYQVHSDDRLWKRKRRHKIGYLNNRYEEEHYIYDAFMPRKLRYCGELFI